MWILSVVPIIFLWTTTPQVCGVTVVHVTVAQGLLRGVAVTSRASGGTYYRFQGIAYAKPPIGELRFKAPQDPDSWIGTKDALSEGASCPQSGKSQEDCLYLNVYSPQLPESTESSLKPVMVWIHGGGFIKGSGTTKGFGPDYLVDEGIVVVTINYRLGVIGFLSLEGTDVASNVGLKDQVAALRWVKQNIAKFGGDPDNVTIFGQSAGGASVNYQVLSPLSAGLFTRAISESGSVFNPWSYMADPRERAFRMGQALGFTGEDDQALVDFLRTLTADELIAAQGKALSQEEKNGGEVYPFVATSESSVSSGDVVFLPDEPIKMMQSGQFNKVPYIIGANSEEYRESATSLNNTPSSWTSLSKSFERYVPLDLGLERGSEQSLQIAEKIRKFYFGDQNMSTSTVPQFCDMETDIMFVKGVYKTSTEFVAHSDAPLYNYQFCYDGRLGVSRVHGSNSTIYGPSHTDELSYIFYYTAVTTPFPENSTEMITLRRMVSIWTNFAKTGNPSAGLDILWSPNTASDHVYLKIDADLSLEKDLEKKRMAFWDEIYKSVGR